MFNHLRTVTWRWSLSKWMRKLHSKWSMWKSIFEHMTLLCRLNIRGLLSDDHAALQTYLQSFNMKLGIVCSRGAPVIRINGNGDTQQSTYASPFVEVKKLKGPTVEGELAAFLMVYAYLDDHEAIRIAVCVQYKWNSASGCSSSGQYTMAKVYKMTWAESWKRRVYTDIFKRIPCLLSTMVAANAHKNRGPASWVSWKLTNVAHFRGKVATARNFGWR